MKRFSVARGQENMFDVFGYILGLEGEYLWLISYYDLGLILGTNIGYYTQVVVFIQFGMKEFGIFTSILSERQTLRLGSYYGLSLVFGTMIAHYTQVVFFFKVIMKGTMIAFEFCLKTNVYDLQAITAWI